MHLPTDLRHGLGLTPRGGVKGGVACAIQPHREVRPESGLSIYEIYDMKACRITTLFSGRVGREKGEG